MDMTKWFSQTVIRYCIIVDFLVESFYEK